MQSPKFTRYHPNPKNTKIYDIFLCPPSPIPENWAAFALLLYFYLPTTLDSVIQWQPLVTIHASVTPRALMRWSKASCGHHSRKAHNSHWLLPPQGSPHTNSSKALLTPDARATSGHHSRRPIQQSNPSLVWAGFSAFSFSNGRS